MDADDYHPTIDALYLSHLDERVRFAMNDENGYWVIPEMRQRLIQARCEEAGYA